MHSVIHESIDLIALKYMTSLSKYNYTDFKRNCFKSAFYNLILKNNKRTENQSKQNSAVKTFNVTCKLCVDKILKTLIFIT